MRIILPVFALAIAITATATAQTADPHFVYPLIKGHGGVVQLTDAAQPPRPYSKVVLDITSDARSGKVLKALETAARIVNLYAQAGVGPGEGLEMAIIFHGKATRAVLADEAYRKHATGDKNPNLSLIQQLKKVGIEVYVCGQALAQHKYALGEVASSVTVADSAASVNINKQLEGAAYLPFH